MSSLNASDIIDNALSAKPQVVLIDPTDKAFKTDGCQPWQLDPAGADDAPPEPSPQAGQAQLGGLLATLGTLGADSHQSDAEPPPRS
jgi:hypothetical protein